MLRKTLTVALATTAITAVSAAVDAGCDDAVKVFVYGLANKDPTDDNSPAMAASLDGPCKYADDACPDTCAAAWTNLTDACYGKEYTSIDGLDTAKDFNSTAFTIFPTIYVYGGGQDGCKGDIELMQASVASDCPTAVSTLVGTYSCAEAQNTDACHDDCQALIDNVAEKCEGEEVGGVAFEAKTFLTGYQEAYSLPASCDYTGGKSSGASVVGASAAAILATASAALLAVA